MPKMKIMVEMTEAEWAEYQQLLAGTHISQEARKKLEPSDLPTMLESMGFKRESRSVNSDLFVREPFVELTYKHEPTGSKALLICRGELAK